MSTFSDPVADADELREAVRGLAHATRTIDDPTSIYAVLSSISSALASLSQSLHQLGEFHDGSTRKQAWMNGDANAGRAASYRESYADIAALQDVSPHSFRRTVATEIDEVYDVEAAMHHLGHTSRPSPSGTTSTDGSSCPTTAPPPTALLPAPRRAMGRLPGAERPSAVTNALSRSVDAL